jgi:hypothetical protein
MLSGDPLASAPIAGATIPPGETEPVFIALQDQAIINVVTLVILKPFTREVPE